MAVTDWNVRFLPPHYHPGTGGWHVGDFEVSRGKEAPERVQVRLTYRAEAVFAGELPGHHVDDSIREQIINRWGEETIHKWLDAGRRVPPSFTLGAQASDDPSVYQLVPLDAQQMLKHWGLRE